MTASTSVCFLTEDLLPSFLNTQKNVILAPLFIFKVKYVANQVQFRLNIYSV